MAFPSQRAALGHLDLTRRMGRPGDHRGRGADRLMHGDVQAPVAGAVARRRSAGSRPARRGSSPRSARRSGSGPSKRGNRPGGARRRSTRRARCGAICTSSASMIANATVTSSTRGRAQRGPLRPRPVLAREQIAPLPAARGGRQHRLDALLPLPALIAASVTRPDPGAQIEQVFVGGIHGLRQPREHQQRAQMPGVSARSDLARFFEPRRSPVCAGSARCARPPTARTSSTTNRQSLVASNATSSRDPRSDARTAHRLAMRRRDPCPLGLARRGIDPLGRDLPSMLVKSHYDRHTGPPQAPRFTNLRGLSALELWRSLLMPSFQWRLLSPRNEHVPGRERDDRCGRDAAVSATRLRAGSRAAARLPSRMQLSSRAPSAPGTTRCSSLSLPACGTPPRSAQRPDRLAFYMGCCPHRPEGPVRSGTLSVSRR